MKEHPIIFLTPMIKALLNGTKTQTRRVLNKQPIDVLPMVNPIKDGFIVLMSRKPNHVQLFKCRYGQVGDRLWCRESWATIAIFDDSAPRDIKPKPPIWYCDTNPDDPTNCGDDKGKQRPSIFMPRWASRITLEITDIKVQRLQEITPNECRDEGMSPFLYKNNFIRTWDSINGNKYSWEDNPWVWAISFEVIK
jgi:hypothetical protein